MVKETGNMASSHSSASGGYQPHTVSLAPAVRAAGAAIAGHRLHEAETLLRERLQAEPDDVSALRMLAEVAALAGHAADARLLLTRALAIAPGFHEARYMLAVLLRRQNEVAAALREATMLRAARPDEPLYRALAAALRAAIGDHTESLALYEGLFAGGHDGPRLRLSYGHGLKTVGRVADSVATYRRLLASNRIEDKPLRGEVWWSIANLKVERLDAADQARIRAELADPKTPEESRAYLHYALGKALEDAGEADAAFAQYGAGAAIRRRRSRYSADKTGGRVRRTIASLTRECLVGKTGAPSPAPIFVLGLPRAGSTLVEQILASHPLVEGTMELVELPKIAEEAGLHGADGDPAAIARLGGEDLRRLGEAYLDRTRAYRKTDRPFFVDKLPDNWLFTGLIRLILPNARIIDVRRAPLAAGVSVFKQIFVRGHMFSYDLDDIGKYYRDYVALMAHVDQISPGAVHRVIYEDLVEEGEAEIRRLLAACGLDFDPACLTFHKTERAIATPSAEQVRKPLYRDALDQWRVFEPHLGPLKAALGPALEGWRGAPTG